MNMLIRVLLKLKFERFWVFEMFAILTTLLIIISLSDPTKTQVKDFLFKYFEKLLKIFIFEN